MRIPNVDLLYLRTLLFLLSNIYNKEIESTCYNPVLLSYIHCEEACTFQE